MLASIAPLLPALRKTAGRYGYAVQYCSRRQMLVALQRGRLIVRKCDSARSARALEQSLRSDVWLSAAELEQLVRVSHVLLYKLESCGQFPRRKRIARRLYAWRASEVDAWLARREAITMSGSRGASVPTPPATLPAYPPCAGCREKLRTLEIDDDGGPGRLIVAHKLWHAAEGRSPCSGLCKSPAPKPQPRKGETMEQSSTDFAELCDECRATFKSLVLSPRRQESMIEGYLFHYCPHNAVHAAWSDGHANYQHCASLEHGEQINGAYVASKRQFAAMAHDLINRALAAAGKASGGKTS